MASVSFDQLVANVALAKKQHVKAKNDFNGKLEKWNAAQSARGISLSHLASVQRAGNLLPPPIPVPNSGVPIDLNKLADELADSVQTFKKASDILSLASETHHKALLDAGAI
jgi:hypothetical protein